MPTVRLDASRDDVRQLLRQLPAILAGAQADPYGIARGLQLRLGVALLSKIQQDFVTKSRGGTGEDGITWAPLTRATIAGRRITRAERKAAGVPGKTRRGLLSAAQDKRWRTIYATRRARLIAKGMSPEEASGRAAAIAWATLKSEGAPTRLEVFGSRKVDSLRDTGELFRSLSPGVDDRPSGADGQVFETPPGRVVVGTNKKAWHHAGIPGKLPARPFWPPDGSIPSAWWAHLVQVYRRGLMVAIAEVIRRGQT